MPKVSIVHCMYMYILVVFYQIEWVVLKDKAIVYDELSVNWLWSYNKYTATEMHINSESGRKFYSCIWDCRATF